MWQVHCPKGSHWQLGLIYEYGSASPQQQCNSRAAMGKISSAFLQNINKDNPRSKGYVKSYFPKELTGDLKTFAARQSLPFCGESRILSYPSCIQANSLHNPPTSQIYHSRAIQVDLTQGFWL